MQLLSEIREKKENTFLKNLLQLMPVVAFVVFGIITIDIMSLWFGSLKTASTYWWVFSYGFLIWFLTGDIIFIFKWSFKNKTGISLCTLAVLIALVLFPANKIFDVGNAEQVLCGLNFLEHPQEGLGATCLLGYPSRQYLFPAIPSFFGGRSFTLLTIGVTFYFIVGLIFFVRGILSYFPYKEADWYASIAAVSILHLFQFNKWMFSFEQSIYPFAFSLMLVGIFLRMKTKAKTNDFYLMCLILLYVIYSYTPGLSLFCLGVLTLLWLIFTMPLDSKNKFLCAMAIAGLCIEMVISLLSRHDVHLVTNDISQQQLIANLFSSVQHIFFQDKGDPIVSSVYHLIVLFVLLTALLNVWGKHVFSLAIWIVTTIVMAIISRGYMYYSQEYDVGFLFLRITHIFPVLFVISICILDGWKPALSRNHFKKVLICLYIIFLITGIRFSQKLVQTRISNTPIRFYQWTQAWSVRKTVSFRFTSISKTF